MVKRTRLLTLLLFLGALSCGLGATHRFGAGSDDDGDNSADTSPSPSPSPAHHHHHHAHPSPTPADDSTPEPDDTPSIKRKHHPTPAESPTPEPSAAESPEPTGSPEPTAKPHPSVAPDASIDSGDLEEFSHLPEKTQALIESSLDLTRQNLTYTYSSADPANGGMDCSGFIYYILTQAGLKDVPRDAGGQYAWVRKAGKFRSVISRGMDGFEMDELKPGDLLFWTNTYATDRDIPVTHTMLYLGREHSTGNRVMAGSSDGRTYHGVERWGVSVFDLKPAGAHSTSSSHPPAQFIGYGGIPGL